MKYNRPHSGNRSANCCTRRRVFGDGRIDHSIASEFFIQVKEAGAGVPRAPQSLADDEYSRIALQQLLASLANRRGIIDFTHETDPQAAKYTCRINSLESGMGD